MEIKRRDFTCPEQGQASLAEATAKMNEWLVGKSITPISVETLARTPISRDYYGNTMESGCVHGLRLWYVERALSEEP